MLHKVNLSPLIESRMNNVVVLQQELVSYATIRRSIDVGSKGDLASYLTREFGPRAIKIAEWFWGADGKNDRVRWLCKFASASSREKKNVRMSMLEDIASLESRRGFLQHVAKPKPTGRQKDPIPAWKRALWELLLWFYEAFRSGDGLPACIFSAGIDTTFSGQDFLQQFRKCNDTLGVCAVCDETDYCTIDETGIHAEIDHFLPKSLYPHLCCHPLNLVPICHNCNASVKRTRDPLTRQKRHRRRLQDIPLPYNGDGLALSTFLAVAIGLGGNGSAHFTRIRPRVMCRTLRNQINTYKEVYELPERWRNKVDQIGEILFRRIQQFVGYTQDTVPGDDIVSVIRSRLDQLLFFMHEQDASKDPYAYVMTWWLAKLINEEVEPFSASDKWPALLEELADWMKLHSDDCNRRLQLVKELKELCK